MAPLQGYTEAEYRRAFADVYGAPDVCYTPFLRMEKGEAARRTLRDINSPLNAGTNTVPQIIFRDAADFEFLTGVLQSDGHRRIDLNLGCPFPPQVGKGRGAGMLVRPDEFRHIAALIAADTSVEYSVKMRLGVDSPQQWQALADDLNAAPLRHIAVHPRVARQQYGGELHLAEVERMLGALRHPLIFNGDLATPAAISDILHTFPALHGVMLGRGLLARPSVLCEWCSGREWSSDERMGALGRLYHRFEELMEARLCGDSQILAKLQPFWHYLEPAIGHKAAKRILKARTLSVYRQEVEAALR